MTDIEIKLRYLYKRIDKVYKKGYKEELTVVKSMIKHLETIGGDNM